MTLLRWIGILLSVILSVPNPVAGAPETDEDCFYYIDCTCRNDPTYRVTVDNLQACLDVYASNATKMYLRMQIETSEQCDLPGLTPDNFYEQICTYEMDPALDCINFLIISYKRFSKMNESREQRMMATECFNMLREFCQRNADRC